MPWNLCFAELYVRFEVGAKFGQCTNFLLSFSQAELSLSFKQMLNTYLKNNVLKGGKWSDRKAKQHVLGQPCSCTPFFFLPLSMSLSHHSFLVSWELGTFPRLFSLPDVFSFLCICEESDAKYRRES